MSAESIKLSLGNFSKTTILPGIILEYYDLTLSDIDNDGFIDIFTILPHTGKVVWYETINNGNFIAENIIFTGDVPFTEKVHSSDLNNDGQANIIWAQQLSVHLNDITAGRNESDFENYFDLYPDPSSSGLII